MNLDFKNNNKIKNIMLRYNINFNLITKLDDTNAKQYISNQLTKGLRFLKTTKDVELFIKDINDLNIGAHICRSQNPYSNITLDISNRSTTRVYIINENGFIQGSCYIVNLYKYFVISI